MGNVFLFEIAISHTISKKEVHAILILFEYIFGIFPYISSSIQKIRSYNKEFSYSKLESVLIYFLDTKFSSLTKEVDDTFFCYYLLIMLLFLLIFIVIYYLLIFFYKKKAKNIFFVSVAINILGLVCFRYFSFLFIDVFQSIFFLGIFKKSNFYTKFFFGIFQIFYYFTILLFIKNFTFYFRVINKALYKTEINYPFDSFAKKHDEFLLVLKILTSLESNYLISKKNIVDNFSYSLNIIILGYSALIFFRFFSGNFLSLGLRGNIENYFVRRFVISFNFIQILINLLSPLSGDLYMELSNMLFNILLSSFLIAFSWFYLEKKIILNRIEKADSDIITALLINEHDKKKGTNESSIPKNFSSSLFELIISRLRINHSFHCNDLQCPLCREDKTKENCCYDEVFYIYNTSRTSKNQEEPYKKYLVYFLYAYIKKDIFGVNKYYHNLVNNKILKAPRTLINSLYFIYTNEFNENSAFSNFYINELMKLNNFNFTLKGILQDFKGFISESVETKKTTTILDISKKLFIQMNQFSKLLREIESKNQNILVKSTLDKKTFNKNSQYNKNIQSIVKYNNIIGRYILETLINGEYSELPKINIDSYEDFLQYHYSNDNLLILSTTFSEEQAQRFKILKITGVKKSIEAGFLDELVPNPLKKEVNDVLANYLRNPKQFSEYNFDLIISHNGYYDHLVYNFQIANSLTKNQLILYGFYSKPTPQSILLYFDKNQNLSIKGYSKQMVTVFGIKPEIFNSIMKKGSNKDCLFKPLFKKIEVATEKSSINNLFHEINQIKCELWMDQYYKMITDELKKEQKRREKHLSSEDFEMLVNNLKKEYENFKEKKLRLLFEKVLPIAKKYCLFKCTYETITRHKESIISPKFNSNAFKLDGLSSTESSEKKNISHKSSKYLTKKIKEIGSTSSVNRNSFSDKPASIRKATKKNQAVTHKLSIIKKESVKISLTTLTVFILNILLLGLCFVFLFVQIEQVNLLTKINTLTYDFKKLKQSFYRVFYSLVSVTCVADGGNGYSKGKCNNFFVNYLDEYQEALGFTDYRITDFVWFELISKVNNLKNYYTTFKSKLSTKEFELFIFLLNTEISFNSLEQQPDKLIQKAETLSFDVALEVTINTHFSLINEATDEKEYLNIPFYILSSVKGIFNLDKIKNQNWNEYQKNAYKLFTNVFSFGVTFNTGDATISNFFDTKKEENIIFSVSFMIIFALLNGLITFMNSKTIKYSYILFKKLFVHIVSRLSNKEYKKFIEGKLNNLIELSNLYKRNPNSIVDSIDSEKRSYQKQSKINGKTPYTCEKSTKTKGEVLDVKDNFKDFEMDNSYQMKEFTEKVIGTLYLKDLILYLFYLVSIGVCDLTLLLLIFGVYSARDYASLNFDFQTIFYSNINLVPVTRIINTTQEDLANLLEKEQSPDGMVSYYIRNSLNYLSDLRDYFRETNFPKQEDYYNSSCEQLYIDIDDEILNNFQSMKGISSEDMNKLPRLVCHDLNFDKFNYFVYEDFLGLLHNLNKRYTSSSVKEIMSLLSDKNFLKNYLYLYFYIRPVKQNFDYEILYPSIEKNVNQYVVFLWIYLILNILFESLIFLLSKILIENKLKTIENYLTLFSQCIQ